jgi:aminotransferase class V
MWIAIGTARLFFDNAGGSLRLTAAEKAFYDADLMPDASEHSNRLALELAELENRARADIRMIFNCRDGEVATGYTASQLMMYIVRLLSEHAEGTNCVTTILEHPSSFDAMTMYAENTDESCALREQIRRRAVSMWKKFSRS